VVAGYNVFLVLEVGESNKRKGEANNSTCELNQNSVSCIFNCYMFNRMSFKSACGMSWINLTFNLLEIHILGFQIVLSKRQNKTSGF
jgi:hypothetical protein